MCASLRRNFHDLNVKVQNCRRVIPFLIMPVATKSAIFKGFCLATIQVIPQLEIMHVPFTRHIVPLLILEKEFYVDRSR